MPTPPRKAVKRSQAARRVGRARPAQRVAPARRSKPAVAQSAGPQPTVVQPASPQPAPPPPAGLPKLRVRMYRQGLGDCFLLTFNPGGDERHMLIDCGTLGSSYTSVKLPDVITEIDKTTNGHLRLVVATHQHQDHLSGFAKLRDQFSPANNKQIDNVWLAWTEDPADPVAKTLTKTRDDMGMAVKASAQAMMHAAGGDQENAMAMNSLLGFFGEGGAGPAVSATGDSSVFAAAPKSSIECVRNLVKQAEYRTPGEPAIEPAWLPGFRFYVLGPPRDLDALHDTGAHGSSELYALAALTGAAMQHASGHVDDDADLAPPFDRRFRLARTDSRIVEALGKTYLADEHKWRSIDTDWLNAASGLAIQLDKFTNNTSLVLAIERIADGKVLLFPGDAQEGNWLSWHGDSVKWDIKRSDGSKVSVTAKDLLARTVFYKVGHHSSHNATAKAKGLEMMTSEKELTSFIPVDRQVALQRNPTGSWKMPARQLYRGLLDKCQGRVVRSDIGWAANVKPGTRSAESEFVGLGSEAEWAKWTKAQQTAKSVQIDTTHIDYLLE